MPYQDPYSGEWYDDSGVPLAQSASGVPGSYLPGYQPQGSGGSPYTSPATGQPAISSWPDYQQGVAPPQAAVAGAPAAPVAGENPQQTPPPSTDPSGSGGGTSNPYAYTDGDGNANTFDPLGFQWPLFTAPQFQAPAPFSYDAFKAPTAEDAANEPGYAFARDQGVKALETSAAAKGTLRTGGTLKDIIGWGDQFANQNYQGAFDRSANTYTMNRNNAADQYSRNYGVSRDVFDRNYQGQRDMFAPKQAAANTTFQTLYQQWRDELNALTQTATAGAGV